MVPVCISVVSATEEVRSAFAEEVLDACASCPAPAVAAADVVSPGAASEVVCRAVNGEVPEMLPEFAPQTVVTSGQQLPKCPHSGLHWQRWPLLYDSPQP